ncbi:DNA polymerase [Candidatus Magnetobacterium casense]|uniref:DNA-directed DNA polymerase n=1 Tax=Candidatus Magnetobacterium casense TaxID=1455061 RepID=A0ABS6RX15_9BACT|nr:DNA polymerase [Candidatus Magnetobacterium casensis]MBV6340338.1 hypothetical protein [Candidatus Magnetobacterium casensis]
MQPFKQYLPTLQPLTEDDELADFSTFDIETAAWTTPYIVGYYHKQHGFKTYTGLDCIHQFMQDLLQRHHREEIIYAHNGGKFDFSFLLQQMMNKDYRKKYTADLTRTQGRVIELRINRIEWADNGPGKKKTPVYHTILRFRDSMSLLPFSLKKLTDSFDVEHPKGEVDHTKITPKNWQEYLPEIIPYLKHDCLGLHEVLTKYQNYCYNKWHISIKEAITTASMAMRIYRRNYQKLALPQYLPYEDVIRLSYVGGRTEIFQHYLDTPGGYYYDVNSLYPSVMHNNPYPVGYPVKTYGFDIHKNFGICQATIDIPKTLDIPPLPFKHIVNKQMKLTFPVGRIKGWFCTPELLMAEKYGCKVDVDFGLDFQKDYIFKGYVEDLYAIKEKPRDNVEKVVTKLKLNSLYGKYGQRREKEQFMFNPKDIIGLTPLTLDDSIPLYSKKVQSKSKHILPAIASFVTSYARCTLYELMQDSDPYYCDTDSIITRKKLPISKALGDLKLEHHIKEGVFILPKMYAFRCYDDCPDKDHLTDGYDILKIKGFPKSFVKEKMTFELLKHSLMTGNFDKIHYKELGKFTTIFESLRRKHKFVSTNDFERSVKARYDKRELIQGSFRTRPLDVTL